MVFKLLRIDTQESCKIQLAIGTHVIGRGKFLHNDDTDKRVSRNHAELEVTTDTVKLKSLHRNPCFYIKKSSEETQLLQQDCTVCLCHGDKFGLLPDYFWYEVLHCPNQDNAVEGTVTLLPKQNGLQNEEENGIDEENNASDISAATVNEAVHFENNEEVTDPNSSASPSLLTTDPDHTNENDVESKVTASCDKKSPAKRSHSSRESSPVDIKKVKIEPVASGDARAGPSNVQLASNTDSKDNIRPVSPAKPTVPLRERCIYGASCYRRNPQHKAQFSHPSDSDWGRGDRGVCPYGRGCRKSDPRHWANHEHPPGVHPPIPDAPRPGKRQNRRQRNVSRASESDEDTPANDLIVTGKRMRKPVNRQDWSESQSEGDEDPYKTDESDEWQPHSDVTNSQDFSQDF